MDDSFLLHRIHFAFTIIYHYIFPQLTMGLALFIAIMKTKALRTDNQTYHEAAQFWIRIFGINFAFGVVTGIPMEFQFGTNWSRFSSAAGGVIGQTLAMEGVFAFFLESAFLGIVIYGEKLVNRVHSLALHHPRMRRFMVISLLYCGDQCLDATSLLVTPLMRTMKLYYKVSQLY